MSGCTHLRCGQRRNSQQTVNGLCDPPWTQPAPASQDGSVRAVRFTAHSEIALAAFAGSTTAVTETRTVIQHRTPSSAMLAAQTPRAQPRPPGGGNPEHGTRAECPAPAPLTSLRAAGNPAPSGQGPRPSPGGPSADSPAETLEELAFLNSLSSPITALLKSRLTPVFPVHSVQDQHWPPWQGWGCTDKVPACQGL